MTKDVIVIIQNCIVFFINQNEDKMINVLIIIPTIGGPDLRRAVESVLNQDFKVWCLVVVDGKQYIEKVNEQLKDVPTWSRFLRCDLPFNTGANGWYGQRIMTAFSYLNDFDYVMFLDQDVWLDADHVSSLVKLIQDSGSDWVYSLRKIYDKNGNYLCEDNCESLGKWPIWHSQDQHLVDNNCYFFKGDFLKSIAPNLYWGWGADRRLFMMMKDTTNYACSGQYTVNYKLGGNEGSVQEEFFKEGNRVMRERYLLTGFPWRNAIIDLPFKV